MAPTVRRTPATAKLDDVNFHTLRHTFASWAVMRGVSLKELQELLGHSTLAMTMRYAHLAPEHLRAAVGRLEGLTSAQPTGPSAQGSTQEPVTVGRSQQRAGPLGACDFVWVGWHRS
jgi:hypothetical protein